MYITSALETKYKYKSNTNTNRNTNANTKTNTNTNTNTDTTTNTEQWPEEGGAEFCTLPPASWKPHLSGIAHLLFGAFWGRPYCLGIRD